MRYKLGILPFLNLLTAATCCSKCDEELLIDLPRGTIRGRMEMNKYHQKEFIAFQQIPYAEPPIGELRFMAPKPVKKWTGILDCTKNDKICHQMMPSHELATEDCLYLNVYTPKTSKRTNLLPVIFHIHGGTFLSNSGILDTWGPHYMIKKNVVVVTVNYRLGIFGFLSTADRLIPGNAGLKDQVLALKWVQDNIHRFGGDPTKVTITGNSAGAVAVGYHFLSNQSTGLFRAGVQFSGSALCPWALQRRPRHHAIQIGALLSANINNSTSSMDLLRLFQSTDAKVLSEVALKYLLAVEESDYEQTFDGLLFAPVVEPNTPDAFFTGHAYNQLETGDFNRIPLMLGICSEEGLMFREVLKQKLTLFQSNPALLTHAGFHIDDTELKVAIGRKIKEIYTNGSLVDDPASGIRLFSDYAFNRAIIKNAQLQSKFTDVFLYQFSYVSKEVGPEWGDVDKVMHDDDTKFLWKQKNGSLTWEEYRIMKSYVSLVVNFATTLNPMPNRDDEKFYDKFWPNVKLDDMKYLNINRRIEVGEDLKEPRFSKWVDLFEKYAVRPYDTF